MIPNLKHLKAFLQVAESGSFISGALRSNMSQPSLSRTIRLLEEELGARLFDRDTRGTVLTPAGRELVGVATRIVTQTSTELSAFNRFLSGDQGQINVIALPSLSAGLLPAAMAEFLPRYPDIRFQIREAAAEEVELAVLGGHADFGLSLKPLDEDFFDWTPLLSDQFGLVMREDDPLAAQAVCDWTTLQTRAFISHVTGANTCRYLSVALRSAGINSQALIQCSEIASAGLYVSRGIAIALLPRMCIPLLGHQGLTWRPLGNPVAARKLGAMTRPLTSLSPAVSAFLALLQTRVSDTLPL
jgi:DNA-binding transcriptional LysR family regulator